LNVKAESPYGSLAQIKEIGEGNAKDIYQTQLVNNSDDVIEVKNSASSDNNTHIINGNCTSSRVSNSLDRTPVDRAVRSVTIAEPAELNTFRSANNNCNKNNATSSAEDYVHLNVENNQMAISSNNHFPTITKNQISMTANTPHFSTVTNNHFPKLNRVRMERNEFPSSFESDELEIPLQQQQQQQLILQQQQQLQQKQQLLLQQQHHQVQVNHRQNKNERFGMNEVYELRENIPGK
jgi:hypothetical protein